MTEEGTQKFTVKDNRRFDSSGNERKDEEKVKSCVVEEVNKDTDKKMKTTGGQPGVLLDDTSETKNDVGDDSEVNFGSFILSLGTQALMQLGMVKPPSGVEVPVDRVAAKQTIEILAVLEAKTKGNLDSDESRLLTEILHNLRMSFVRTATK